MAQAASVVSRLARNASRHAASTVRGALRSRLADSFPQETVDEIVAFALKKQTGVSLKYMLDFGANPIQHQMILSAQFLHRELPVRLAHRVAELENLPYGLQIAGRFGRDEQVLAVAQALAEHQDSETNRMPNG